MAIVMRMVRATMLEVLSQDYVRTARAKGVPRRRRIVFRHALRNALIPVVTVVGFEVGVLMSGAAIVEIIFGLPGVGNLLLQRDLQPRLPVDPGDDDADRRHLHRLQPARRPRLRLPRPEDRGSVSFDGAGPCSRPRASARSATAWSEVPRSRLDFLGRVAQPDRPRRRRDRRRSTSWPRSSAASSGRSTPTSRPRTRLLAPSWAHPFGTDELGRDTLARVIHGAQVSLQVGAISVGIAFAAGLADRAARRLLPRLARPRA